MIPNPDSWSLSILATDINREALQKAREGVYGAWSFRGVDKRIQDIYFRQDSSRQFVLDDKIKRMVTFDHLNLVGDYYPSLVNNTNAMDVILCRNVTIYFAPEVTVQVVNRFHSCLVDGGWLIPGAAEPNMVFYGDFSPVYWPGAVMYRKVGASRADAPSVPAFLPETNAHVPRTAPANFVPAEPAGRPPDTYQQALELQDGGRFQEALAKLYAKLDEDPGFLPAYDTLARIYASQGNLAQAEVWCERAIKKDKLRPEPYYLLGLVYQQHGLLEMALDALKKTIYLDREFVLAHYDLAHVYLRQGDTRSARRPLQNVRQLLAGRPKDQPIPEGDGLVAGRLRELVETELALEAGEHEGGLRG